MALKRQPSRNGKTTLQSHFFFFFDGQELSTRDSENTLPMIAVTLSCCIHDVSTCNCSRVLHGRFGRVHACVHAWHGMAWHGMAWDGMGWDGMVGWDGMRWDGMVAWDGMGWDGMVGWDGMRWDGMVAWDGMGWDGMGWWDGMA